MGAIGITGIRHSYHLLCYRRTLNLTTDHAVVLRAGIGERTKRHRIRIVCTENVGVSAHGPGWLPDICQVAGRQGRLVVQSESIGYRCDSRFGYGSQRMCLMGNAGGEVVCAVTGFKGQFVVFFLVVVIGIVPQVVHVYVLEEGQLVVELFVIEVVRYKSAQLR